MKKLAVYSDSTQSNQVLYESLEDYFLSKNNRFGLGNIKEHFEEQLISNKPLDHKELRKAIDYCRNNVATLLVVRDISGRGRLETLELLLQSNVPILLISDSEEITSYAIKNWIEKEREIRKNISDGTIAGIAKREKQGELLRNPDTTLATQAKKAKAVKDAQILMKEIEKLSVADLKNYASITRALNQKGVTSSRGNKINEMAVSRVLKRFGKTLKGLCS